MLCRAIKLKDEVMKEIVSWKNGTWVLQEFIEDFEAIAIDFVAQEGVIKAFLIFNLGPDFDMNIAKKGFIAKLVKDDKILEFTTRFVEYHDLSGIFEVEFMLRKTGDHFIMEVNPRASGYVSTFAICDTIGGKKYTWVETIIKEYLNLVNSEMFNYKVPTAMDTKCESSFIPGIGFGKPGFNKIAKNSLRYIFSTSQWAPSFKKSNIEANQNMNKKIPLP